MKASPELASLGGCLPSSRELRNKCVNQSRDEILLDGAQIRGMVCAYVLCVFVLCAGKELLA